MPQKRIRDYGITIGRMETGKVNKITDVPGVKVGHTTIKNEENHTGVTVILPGEDNAFAKKYTAASYVHNGFGKSAGLVQIDELGTLETPIALTNTLNVGLVWDALAEYVIRQCREDNVPVRSLNPVVGECNDSQINHIQNRAVSTEDVLSAIRQAGIDFAEGDVGAGAGTICYGLKGGIGSSSRIVKIDGKTYTIGVLVQSNFGSTADFVLNGIPAGEKILQIIKERGNKGGSVNKDIDECIDKNTDVNIDKNTDKNTDVNVPEGGAGQIATSDLDQGSIMTILATDLPVSSRQLKRIIRRTAVGIARTGAYTGHGSGEVMIGFTTANRVPADGEEKLLSQTIMNENLINSAFQAAAEAAHEAIVNSMVCAERTRGLDGKIFCSLAEFLPQLR